VAEAVHRALDVLGAKVELLTDPEGDLLTKAEGPVVVVGNLADSRCVRELYFRFLCATDLWYPGPGGYELRTLCDPFGTGSNVVLIGYSDPEGAGAATGEFLSRLKDPIPHLAVLKVTRLPLSGRDGERFRNEALPQSAWQVANTTLGDSKGYLYYLTGDPKLGEEYRRSWKGIIESGYERTEKIVQAHLYSLSRVLPWRLVESMDLFSKDERLAVTRFLYGWAESEEGWHHVARCPRVRSPYLPRQNHELIPALALAYTADYFATHFPQVGGPQEWRKAAAQAFKPYGESWKPLCDGLCHGWWLSQPVMLEYALLDPQHRYFERGGARKAAECAMAVVNNEGWLPSAGDADMRRQFPGANLRIAAAYFNDGRYRFVDELATADRRLAWQCVPVRAFAAGGEPRVPSDKISVTVVPVDPLVYQVWQRDPRQASGVVRTAPSAPIDQCFDKLAVRAGWELKDDYLLIDGLGGGSHAYDDAGGILDYARLGLSLIVSEDSFVHSAPEHHSVVTIVRDGVSGVIPGFAVLEANETDRQGNVYLRIRSKDYAGADWVREVHLLPGSCAVFRDTVIANQAGNFAVEARFRSPARLVVHGREAHCVRKSPCVGDVEFRIQSLCRESQLRVVEVPVQLRYQSKEDRELWKERYRTENVVLTALVARAAGHLEPGECVCLTHLAQVCAPGEAQLNLATAEEGICLSDDKTRIPLTTIELGRPVETTPEVSGSVAEPAPVQFLEVAHRISALCPMNDGSLILGTQKGQVSFLHPQGHEAWSADLVGPVHDIGVAQGEEVVLAVGHGPNKLTAFDKQGRLLWAQEIEREPCPWPWWELPTPAAVQVAGGVCAKDPFFAVGCGDIKVRGFDRNGNQRWRWRYNEGVPGRIQIADVDGSGRPRIVVGGEILSDTSCCRILDPDGHLVASLGVEWWTSILTALAFGDAGDRHFIACGANRGNNLHLFELVPGRPGVNRTGAKDNLAEALPGWKRLWSKQLGGGVTGIQILGPKDRLIAVTSQGFVLCYDLNGKLLWNRLFAQGVEHLASLGSETVVCDGSGELSMVSLSGDVGTLFRMPGPCSIVLQTDTSIYLACGRTLWRIQR